MASRRVGQRIGSETMRVAASELERFIRGAFEAVGLPEADAGRLGVLITQADLYGAETHGAFRLPQYVARLKRGAINPRPNIRIAAETVATAVVDGDNGMGHLVVERAARLAIDKAERAGIGWVGVRYSNHAGPGFLYARMPLAHDMAGIYVAVGNSNHMAAWGGLTPMLGTNPIAIAVPGLEEPPVVLDMATSNSAFGKIRLAQSRGEPLPEGWLVDRAGRPITDSAKADEGLLVPIGGPKGSGLALMIALLGGVLNGAAAGGSVVDFNVNAAGQPTNTGHAIAAIKLAALGDSAAIKRGVDRFVREVRASEPVPGGPPVRVPGERGEALYREQLRRGIAIHPKLWDSLHKVARDLGVPPPEGRPD
jgi:LDH2 family malate/lactate/ureidoglycolate dehydrogenase